MDVEPQPPPGQTLTLGFAANPPPEIPPPEPPNPPPPKKNLPAESLEDPHGYSPAEKLNEHHIREFEAFIAKARDPFSFTTDNHFSFNGSIEGQSNPEGVFNASAQLIIEVLQGGRDAPANPSTEGVGTTDWARLTCALLAAMGRGYTLQYDQSRSIAEIWKGWDEAPDPDPLATKYPTLFHRAAVTASLLDDQITADKDGFLSYATKLKADIHDIALKAAHAEVEEKTRQWKANQIERRTADLEKEISAEASRRNADYFLRAAAELGLRPPPPPQAVPPAPKCGTPRGKKCTISGSTPCESPTPDTPKASFVHSTATPRGRPTIQPPLPRRWADPSPTPQPKKRTNAAPQAVLNLSPKVTLNLGPKIGTAPTTGAGQLDAASIMAAIKDAMAPAIQTAMAPYAARLFTLERSSMPPPPTARAIPQPNQAEPSGRHGTATQAAAHPTQVEQEGEFTLVHRNGKNRKGKGKAMAAGPTPDQPHQATPPSYAGAAAAATNIQQPQPLKKGTAQLPTITEVTVLRTGGLLDTLKESQIRARAADAIVREVRLKMAKATIKPIRLRAGRWSITPRSKGNFVYSFDGNIPFDIIKSYEHILLSPLGGVGELCPSMGWTRFLANGVPVWDEDDTPFSPDQLLEEVRTLPGLKKAFFAMQPRWLTHTDQIFTDYSSVTFAISDPDGTISNTLINNRAALFGKDVTVRKWIDKPAFIQCSRCHALGHNKASRVCSLSKDSVKCYKCGGAHISEEHDKHCARKHTIAGICDCKQTCLNCHTPGHNCREPKCPARDRYRPRNARKLKKNKNKPKPIDLEEHMYRWEEGVWDYPPEENDEDPYNNDPPLSPPRNARSPPPPQGPPDRSTPPTWRPARTSPAGSQVMNVDHDTTDPFTDRQTANAHDNPPLEGVRDSTLLWKGYSPSRPHGDANPWTHA